MARINTTEVQDLQDMQRIAPGLISHPVFPALVAVRRAVRERFPKGAMNRVDVVERAGLTSEQIFNQLVTLRLEDCLERLIDIEHAARTTAKVDFADCGFIASYALGFIKTNYSELVVETVFWGNHQAVLIGRDVMSVGDDYDTWNEDAIICDVWADKYYCVKQLPEQRGLENDIPFYSIYLMSSIAGLVRSQEHYLAADPDVLTGPACVAYERRLCAWFQQEKLYRQQLLTPEVRLSSLSMHSSSLALSKTEVVLYLEQVTSKTGWVYNKSKNQGGCICTDKAEATQIVERLRHTGAMSVVSGKNVNGHFQVNISKLDADKIRAFNVSTDMPAMSV